MRVTSMIQLMGAGLFAGAACFPSGLGVEAFSCERTAQCAEGFWCVDGTCRPERDDGGAGFDVDGGQHVEVGLRAGLVAYWSFDVDGHDLHGSHDAVPLSGGRPTASGLLGQTFDFAATRSLTVADHDELSFADGGVDEPFTWALWINPRRLPTNTTNRQWLISKRGQGQAQGREYQLVLDSGGTLTLSLFDDPVAAQLVTETVSPLTANRWTHVAVSYDGSATNEGVAFFIDGAPAAAAARNVGAYRGMTPSARPMLLSGQLWDSAAAPVVGALDEVGLWRRVLAPSEIATLWNGDAGLPYPFGP